MYDIEEMREFYIEAGTDTWATANSQREKKEKDHSTTFNYKKGKWSYTDNFFGGEPYGGREVIFYDGNPVWMMVYYGLIYDSKADDGEIYKLLQKILAEGKQTSDKPMRGPEKFESTPYRYNNVTDGSFELFSGTEMIYANGVEIYTANFTGGMVAQR